MIGSGIFTYIYHVGCTFNLHSIINNGLVLGGQNLSRRQTVFFLPIDPRDKNHKDPKYIEFSVPRRAKYVHNAWKKHQDAVFWVDIDLVRGVSWSEVATVPKRKSHRGLDLDLSLNSEVNIRKGWKENGGTK